QDVVELEEIQAQREASARNYLEQATLRNEELQERHKALSAQLEEARQEGGVSPALVAELDRYRMMEGTVDATGPGIVITIDDRQQDNRYVGSLSIEYLRRIINTLKFAGAEAISVNGQRIVASTSIVLSGTSTILVNQVPITRSEGIPYEILAIGNQDELLSYFNNLEAPILKQLGMSVTALRKTVQIPSFKGIAPIKEGEI
ncbi:MAG: DUF881 domain-containing protein, partial [Desulfitobacterium sp.]|nr:DUF881 domain-containing protein [Desulfitobacterium sp.]